GGAGDEHAIAHAHRARVRVVVLARTPRADALRRGLRAVDRVELDLDELLGPRQPRDLHQRRRRARVAEVLRDRARGLVGYGDVGDVHAVAHDVSQPAAGLGHAPLGDLHDRVHLLHDVADAAHVAL